MAMSTKKIVLIVVGVVALLVIVIGAFVGGIIWIVWEATAEPVRVTRDHLDATTRGDYERAYGLYSPALQAELPFEQFTDMAQQNPQVFKVADTTFTHRNIENDACTLRGTITSLDGGKTPVRVTLMNEGGQWRIRGFRWGEAAAEDES